jgi:hypothetical protein
VSPFGWFAAGMCVALGGQWLGMLLVAWQRQRFYADFHRRRRGSNPPPPGRKQPPPPAPGMRREYIYSPATMAECGGPCWDAWDPRSCTCGALWRDVPCKPPAFTEGPVQRGQGNGGPSTGRVQP